MARVVNPYSFVPLGPAPRRAKLDDYYAGQTLLTGRLDYTLTTDTPLLIPDTAKTATEPSGHRTSPFFRLPDGTPAVPGSEVRGAVRNVYEAVTHSCMPVLRDSTAYPFSQRLPSTNGFKSHGLLGYDPQTKQWALYAAATVDFIKLTEANYAASMVGGRLSWGGKEYRSGQHTRLRSDGPEGWLQFNKPVAAPKEGKKTSAYYVRLLAPRTDRPALFQWADDTPYQDLRYVLGESAKNDRGSAAHGDLLAALEKAKQQGGMVPVWYLLADDNGTQRCYLSGASIGRVMQNRSWAEVMGSHAPCKDLDALCPGCALFGTVKGEGTTGRVRFTDAAAAKAESLGSRTLPILSSPKPSAYEFYLERPQEKKAIFWNYDFCAVNDPFKPFRVYTPKVRGRKLYWHGRPQTETARTNQNATLEAMQGTFRGSVYFDRITKEQLEELAFALTLGDNSPASTRLYKLGHGKPVGYGSVKLTLTGGELRTVALQDGALRYETRPLPLRELLAAHGRIDPADETVRSLLRILDKTSTADKTVAYPKAKNRAGDAKIFNWFAQNRQNQKRNGLTTLPHPLDADITIQSDTEGASQPYPPRPYAPRPYPPRPATPRPAAPTRTVASAPHPAAAPTAELEVGGVYTGTVKTLFSYAALVELENHRIGKVKNREIANHWVSDASEELRLGQTVKVKVLNIETVDGRQRIDLSIKQAQ